MSYLSITSLVALVWLLTSIACTLTIGRFAIYWNRKKIIGPEIILNGIASVLLVGFTATWQVLVPKAYEAAISRLGHSGNPSTPRHDSLATRQVDLTNALFFWLCIYLVKASFLILYWNLFHVSTRFRIAWVAVVIYASLGLIVTIAFRLTACGSPGDVLNAEKCEKEKTAMVFVKAQVTWSVIDGVGDILLVLIPLIMLRGTLMPLSTKIQLGLLFGLVSINLATNVLRALYTINTYLTDHKFLNALWPVLQCSTAVMICALPSYGRFLHFRKYHTEPVLM
ncbi:unnamed protein product [Periconia digitata]|uniref:Rhodopsin domain-containing protein n=1 Tax=Periconia digitata TaxID=1303443 RepID=A0A9W4XFY0_9PLEO|nr:unnamed protein product [Periconia digitata]